MLIIFPLIYLTSFIFALRGILLGKREEVLLFIIFGLPIYITSLCIAFDSGFSGLISMFQLFKEIIIVTLLGIQVWTLNRKIHFHFIDYAVMAYFAYTFIYAVLPIGDEGILVRLLAFKSISFFGLVYFSGRLFNSKEIYINKYFHYILYLTIAAAIIVGLEYSNSIHFQSLTGFADFYYYIYNFDPTGSYGLSYTFETDTGIMRFASFFANPLELASSTILALSVLAALATTDSNKLRLTNFNKVALFATIICIFLAFSRAAFVNYFFTILVYAVISRNKLILNTFYFIVVSSVLYVVYLLKDEEVLDFVIETLKFTNSSSVGHLLEWIEGINAMMAQPLGLGLGTSGRVGGSFNGNTGGENQFLIIGVQTGIVAMLIYLSIYILLMFNCLKWIQRLKGKERQVCLALLLMKTGFIIPMMTSELESSAYISYTTWFLSGLFISIISYHQAPKLPQAKASSLV
jgi:hypothetical protein